MSKRPSNVEGAFDGGYSEVERVVYLSFSTVNADALFLALEEQVHLGPANGADAFRLATALFVDDDLRVLHGALGLALDAVGFIFGHFVLPPFYTVLPTIASS
jgi:hypothetical protein